MHGAYQVLGTFLRGFILSPHSGRNPETLAQLNDLPKVTQKVVLELDLEPMTYDSRVCNTINYYSDTLEEKHNSSKRHIGTHFSKVNN